jgi:hypothetical protein
MGFGSDLAFGKQYEKLLLDYIEHDTVEFAPKCCKGWDVALTYEGYTVKYEVKSDRMACTTGNVAIEIACNGKPSGVSSTEANFYAYFIVYPTMSPTLYLIPTDALKELIIDKKYRRVKGGDGWRSEMVLVPIADFYEFIF